MRVSDSGFMQSWQTWQTTQGIVFVRIPALCSARLGRVCTPDIRSGAFPSASLVAAGRGQWLCRYADSAGGEPAWTARNQRGGARHDQTDEVTIKTFPSILASVVAVSIAVARDRKLTFRINDHLRSVPRVSEPHAPLPQFDSAEAAPHSATGMNHSFLIWGSMLRPVALWQTRLLAETPVAIASGRFHFEGRWPLLPGSGGDWKCAGRGRLALHSHLGGPARIDLWCLSLRPARCSFPQRSTGATLERHPLPTPAGLSIWQGNDCTEPGSLISPTLPVAPMSRTRMAPSDSRMRAYGYGQNSAPSGSA